MKGSVHGYIRTIEYDQHRCVGRRIRAHCPVLSSRLPTLTALPLPKHNLDALAWTRRSGSHLARVEAAREDLELLVNMIVRW